MPTAKAPNPDTAPDEARAEAPLRLKLQAKGKRAVQFEVPNTDSARFAQTLRQQCLALNPKTHELEALRFAEEAAGQIEGWR